MRRYRIPIVKEEAEVDQRCPHCERPSGHMHEREERAVIEAGIGHEPADAVRVVWAEPDLPAGGLKTPARKESRGATAFHEE